MSSYVRIESAEAYQIDFTNEQKEAVRKGIPTTAHGDHIKLNDGVFSVAIHLGDDVKMAFESDWVVSEESGKKLVLTDEKFHEIYTEWDEEDEEDGDDELDLESERVPEEKLPDSETEPVKDGESLGEAGPAEESKPGDQSGSETAVD